MKPALSVLALGVCLASLPLSAQDRSHGKDITPPEVQKKLYKWGKEEKEDKSFKAMMAGPAEKWLNRTTAPMDGFVILASGERLVGQLSIHNRLTAQASMGGVIPDSANYYPDVTLVHDGKTDKFVPASISAYGAQFTPADWTPIKKSKDIADNFNPGFVQLSNDVRLDGVVALTSSVPANNALRTFDRVYYAANATSPVEMYFTARVGRPGPSVIEAGQKAATEAAWHLLRGGLVDQNAWIATLEKTPKALSADALVPGEVVFANGATLKGRLAVESGKTKYGAYLIDDDGDLLYVPAEASVKVMNATVSGVAQHFVVANGEFLNNQDAIARFEKDGTLHPGKVVLPGGQELVGKVSFRRASNLIKSYRIPLGTYFVPATDGAMLSYYSPDQVEFVDDSAEGATTRYAPLENSLVSQDKYLSGLESSNSSTKTKNLQAGYVMMDDGSKQSGRIAARGGEIVLVDAGNHFKKYYPTDKGLTYYVQTIDGAERRFIPLQGGIHAFSAPAMEFVEVFGADKAYSWYLNPKPTHIHKFATKLVTGAMSVAGDVGSAALATAAAKEQVKESLKKNPGDVGAAVVAGAQAQQGVIEKTQGMVTASDEGGFFFTEWVVVNNASKEKTVIYSGNDTQELTKLLTQCPKYAALETRAAKRMTDVGNIDSAVNFLNACR